MQKSKEKRKHKSRRLRLTWGYILPPITAFLIMILPPFFSSEMVNYLFSDRLIYPLAYILARWQLHFTFAVLLLFLWVAIRIIRYRQFLLEILISVCVVVVGLLMSGGIVVWTYKTTEHIAVNDANYYLRQAVIHDYTDAWSERTGKYDVVHKCDPISIFCETVFLQHTNTWHVEHRSLTLRVENNILLLVCVSNDINQPDQVVATIEDNLDTTTP